MKNPHGKEKRLGQAGTKTKGEGSEDNGISKRRAESGEEIEGVLRGNEDKPIRQKMSDQSEDTQIKSRRPDSIAPEMGFNGRCKDLVRGRNEPHRRQLQKSQAEG